MTCKLCDHFRDRFWAHSDAWEWSASNDEQLLSDESDQTWALIERAADIQDTDPASAFQQSLRAAEAGSVWSMTKVGWHYWTGTGVDADPRAALEYYDRAISGGSCMATIHQARLLAEMGDRDLCERSLANGVASDFVPAYFWLAWLRYERSRTGQVRTQVRPLLEYAAAKGHPAANLVLSRWMLFGKFGLREMPRGLRLAAKGVVSFAGRLEHARLPNVPNAGKAALSS